MRVVNADTLVDFLIDMDEETKDIFLDMAQQRNLTYENGVEELAVLDYTKDVINSIINVINTEPTVDALVLPFKVGDTIWSAAPFKDRKIRKGHITMVLVDDSGVFSFYTGFEGEPVSAGFLVSDIGKTVFFTYEEAELMPSRNRGNK